MRIISGKYKGRIIRPPKNFRARPTTDFAKEGLFNVLNNIIDIENSRVLDLFSGTGSVGFEFASRGAVYVEMVEKNFTHYRFIEKTIREIKMENVKVIKTDCFRYIKASRKEFDLVFADPPYDLHNFDTIPGLIMQSELLRKEGHMIIEHSKAYNFSALSGFRESRNYGGVSFSFFEKL